MFSQGKKRNGWAPAALGAGFAAALAMGTANVATAQSFSYSTSVRQVKVGIVRPRNWARPTAPNLFHVLDQRVDLKPAGWDLINPMAPDRVDVNMTRRWNRSGNVSPGTRTADDPYARDDSLSENMAGYWDVPLEHVGTDQLSQFDLLYLPSPQSGQNTTLSTGERDQLRKAVDSGVTLWIERPGSNLSVRDFNLFIGVGYRAGSSSIGPVKVAQPLHPVLNVPYTVGQGDLNRLFGSVTSVPIDSASQVTSIDRAVVSTLVQDQTGKTVVAAGAYGSGAVVMSANIGEMINGAVRRGSSTWPFETGNQGGYSGTDTTRVPVDALKFAFNVISSNQESPQERRGPRRLASTFEPHGAPLTRKWTFPDKIGGDPTMGKSWNSANLTVPWASPAVYKGIVVVPAANSRLYAFDLDPMRDIDGDGNPDDGWGNSGPMTRDYDLLAGAPYDILWEADLGAEIQAQTKLISTPTIATVNDRTRGPIDVVYVSTEDGKLYAFELIPKQGSRMSGEPKPYWKAPVQISDAYPLQPGITQRMPSPVFGEGRLFAVGISGVEGVVMELDPQSGNELWRYQRSKKPLQTVPPSIGLLMATPVLAWVDDRATGAKDLVLYVPSFAEPTQGQTGRIFSFLLSVRGERLTDSGDHKQYRSRYWLAPTNLPWSGNSAIRTTGLVTGTPINGRPGWVEMSATLSPDAIVTADYDLDTTANNYKPRSAFYAFTGNNGQYPNFLASPVLGPDDTLYAVATDMNRGISSLYAFRDQSPIAYVKWRYTLPFGSRVVGSPAYHNGAVYVATDRGEVVGFDANATFSIDVAGILDEPRKFQVSLVQEDPTLPKAFQNVAFTYNQSQFEAANITDVDPLTRLPRVHLRIMVRNFSMSGSTSLDASLPVRVRFPTAGQTAQAEESSEIRANTSLCGDASQLFPGATNRNANKLFDMVLPTLSPGLGGNSVVSGPVVAGDMLYIATRDGMIHAMPADPCALVGAGRFASAVRPLPATAPVPPALMAIPAGGSTNILGSVVLTNGNLIANTPGGVMAFQQPVTLLADANRLLETRNSFDMEATGASSSSPTAGSEIVWALNSTVRYNALPEPGAGRMPQFSGALPSPERRNIAHPASVKRLTSTNFLFADTGNNRVVEVDRAGTVLWELGSFADPYNLLGGSEPLTLNTPTDVQRWTEVRPSGAIEMHTLVVDNGNNRILEVRDTFISDPGSGDTPEYHVLVWASRTTQGDRHLEYRNAQRVPGGIPGLSEGSYTIATVGNWRINSVDGSVPDTPGSSLVILNGPRRAADGTIADPGGQVVAFARDLTFGTGASASRRAIANPSSFQRFFTGAGANEWRGLMTDGEGFYELAGRLDSNTREITLNVTGAVIGRAAMAPTGFNGLVTAQASGIVMAKRLASGNTLVVNQALGQIFEYQQGVGFLPLSPSTAGTHALAQPSSADRTF